MGPWSPRCWIFYITHTHTHTRMHTQGRTPLNEWPSPPPRPLPTQKSTNPRDENPCLQRDSNSQIKQSGGFTSTFFLFVTVNFFAIKMAINKNTRRTCMKFGKEKEHKHAYKFCDKYCCPSVCSYELHSSQYVILRLCTAMKIVWMPLLINAFWTLVIWSFHGLDKDGGLWKWYRNC